MCYLNKQVSLLSLFSRDTLRSVIILLSTLSPPRYQKSQNPLPRTCSSIAIVVSSLYFTPVSNLPSLLNHELCLRQVCCIGRITPEFCCVRSCLTYSDSIAYVMNRLLWPELQSFCLRDAGFQVSIFDRLHTSSYDGFRGSYGCLQSYCRVVG